MSRIGRITTIDELGVPHVQSGDLIYGGTVPYEGSLGDLVAFLPYWDEDHLYALDITHIPRELEEMPEEWFEQYA